MLLYRASVRQHPAFDAFRDLALRAAAEVRRLLRSKERTDERPNARRRGTAGIVG